MTIYTEYPEELDYDKAFSKAFFGVALKDTGENTLVYIIVEDDEVWFVDKGSGFDSLWLSDLRKQMKAARKWLKANGK